MTQSQAHSGLSSQALPILPSRQLQGQRVLLLGTCTFLPLCSSNLPEKSTFCSLIQFHALNLGLEKQAMTLKVEDSHLRNGNVLVSSTCLCNYWFFCPCKFRWVRKCLCSSSEARWSIYLDYLFKKLFEAYHLTPTEKFGFFSHMQWFCSSGALYELLRYSEKRANRVLQGNQK